MKNEHFDEHPLDSMLDSESEEEFGDPEIRDRLHHHADADSNGNLKNWTAEDFSSIYIRFRPHLERHARRYLSNPVQAEEVVQDSFLYLMTTLPELDSELGVLKFLKWKIRLLSLDVIRSNSAQRETAVAEHSEFASDDEELSADLERAEDNAVIRMALAKLNPRQREALLAIVYEEKTTEEVAEQLGLSGNATRQLVFRARGAFKKALVGEAEIKGKSISQVLSLASKKAAMEAKENAAKVGAFIVLLAVGIGVVPSLAPDSEITTAQEPVISPLVSDSEPSVVTPTEEQDVKEVTPSSDETSPVPTEPVVALPVSEIKEPSVAEPLPASIPPAPVSEVEAPTTQLLDADSLGSIMATNVVDAGIYTNSYSKAFSDSFGGTSVEVFGGTGISAFLDLDVDSKTVKQAVYQMWVNGERYYGVARNTTVKTQELSTGFRVDVVSSEFYVVDEAGRVFSESPLAGSRSSVTLNLDINGSPQSASMSIEDKAN